MGKTMQSSVWKKGILKTAVAETEPGAAIRYFHKRRMSPSSDCPGTLAELLCKDYTDFKECPNDFQLIHVISCSRNIHGFLADVNWYTGGNSYVTLPNITAEKKPGVYLVKAKRIQWHYQLWMVGFTSITHLRWLGTCSQCATIAKDKGTDLAPYGLSWFGEKELELLMEMLSANADSECVSAVVAASQF